MVRINHLFTTLKMMELTDLLLVSWLLVGGRLSTTSHCLSIMRMDTSIRCNSRINMDKKQYWLNLQEILLLGWELVQKKQGASKTRYFYHHSLWPEDFKNRECLWFKISANTLSFMISWKNITSMTLLKEESIDLNLSINTYKFPVTQMTLLT